MRLQVLSDLHLESESFVPQPAAGAELLVLAGDIDASWKGYERFAGWPVPVLVVAGNHEFDGRDLVHGLANLRAQCERFGLTLLHREERLLSDDRGRAIRFLGTPLWSDFGLFGEAGRVKAEKAARYYLRQMASTRDGVPLDVAELKLEGALCRDWLTEHLNRPGSRAVDATVVITHFAPSLRSADPRYGRQPGTASFCNAADDLIPLADLWIHGHLHCRHDYTVSRSSPGSGEPQPPSRVICQARGLGKKGEELGFVPDRLFEV